MGSDIPSDQSECRTVFIRRTAISAVSLLIKMAPESDISVHPFLTATLELRVRFRFCGDRGISISCNSFRYLSRVLHDFDVSYIRNNPISKLNLDNGVYAEVIHREGRCQLDIRRTRSNGVSIYEHGIVHLHNGLRSIFRSLKSLGCIANQITTMKTLLLDIFARSDRYFCSACNPLECWMAFHECQTLQRRQFITKEKISYVLKHKLYYDQELLAAFRYQHPECSNVLQVLQGVIRDSKFREDIISLRQ